MTDEHLEVIDRLRQLGAGPVDPTMASAVLARMAAAEHHGVGGPHVVAGATELVAVPATRHRARRRVAALVAASALVGTGGIAAATGSLPAPAQRAAHEVLGRIGVEVPERPDADRPAEQRPFEGPEEPVRSASTSTTPAVGTGTGAPAGAPSVPPAAGSPTMPPGTPSSGTSTGPTTATTAVDEPSTTTGPPTTPTTATPATVTTIPTTGTGPSVPTTPASPTTVTVPSSRVPPTTSLAPAVPVDRAPPARPVVPSGSAPTTGQP